MAMTIAREQVIAYRLAAQQLDRRTTRVDDLAVLDLGVQEAAGEQARLALDARLAATPPVDLFGEGRPLALVWSVRGAPHVHRRVALDDLARALVPLSEADARHRLNETGPSVERLGIPAQEQYAIAVAAMREAVRRPTGKGAVSTAVSAAIPAGMRRACRACGTSHISDSAMRAAFLAAGLELEPGTSPPVLLPRRGRVAHPSRTDLDALGRLVRCYLGLLGPATVTEAADYLGARRADVQRAWPDGLAQVEVEGRRVALPEERLADLEAAEPGGIVRLLPMVDPYLQARDRDLIVPDPGLQKLLWPVLGRPGAVLVGGEIAGVWRPKSSGSRLTVTVTAVHRMTGAAWSAVESEAERVAVVRGAATVRTVRA